MPVFVHPLWLLLPLLVIPAAVVAHAMHLRHGGKLGPLVPQRLRARLLPPGGGHLPAARLASRFILLGLLGLALARPQLGEEGVVETADARDLLLAVDTSRSMLATDVPPNRIELAKLSCLDLIKALPDDRFGVLAFAGSAFPLAPLTTDHDAIRETVMAIDTETLPVGGTNLAAAVQMAMEAFDEPGPRQRAMVILSDGEDLEGKFEGVARKAKEKGIIIFAFAIGTERGAMLPDTRAQGGFIRDERGQPVVSKSSLDALNALATATGGYAQMLAGPGALPAQMNDALRRLQSASTEEKTRRQAAEQFQWPLGLALIAFIVCLLLPPAGQRAGDQRSPLPSGMSGQPVAMILFFAILWLSMGAASPTWAAATGKADPTDPAAQAALAHQQGDYARAIESAGSALVGATPDRRALVSANLGNSLYEAGRSGLPEDDKKWTIPDMQKALVDWEDGLGHLDHSLALRPDNKAVAENRTKVAGAIEELRRRIKDIEEQEKQKEKQQQEQQKKEEQEKQQNQDPKDEGQQSQKGEQGEKDQQGQEGDPGGQGQNPDQRTGQEGQQPEGKEGQQGNEPKDGEKPDDQGQEQGKKDGQGEEGKQANQQGEQGEIKDASSGEKPEGRATAQSIPMQIGPDGRILLPEDPRERARFLEAVRRNLQQRSMEEKNVRLIPVPKDIRPPEKNW